MSSLMSEIDSCLALIGVRLVYKTIRISAAIKDTYQYKTLSLAISSNVIYTRVLGGELYTRDKMQDDGALHLHNKEKVWTVVILIQSPSFIEQNFFQYKIGYIYMIQLQ